MASLMRGQQPERPQAAVPARMEPLRLMRSLLNWDPFQEMAPLLQRMPVEFVPDFEVKETKDLYVFRADVPGVKMNDLDITLSNDRLTITGKRESEQEEKGDTYYACERAYGTFTRSFTMPDSADPNGVTADLRDGVLTISVKRKAATQPKKIDIKAQPPDQKPH